MSNIVTRFAPSPTGYMHIGNLRTALYSYLVAKSQGGKFILRIEDTDQKRLIEGAVEVILNTLKLTGLNYDEGPLVGGEHGPYIQSERKDIYAKYVQELIEKDKAYYCFCDEERLNKVREETGNYDRHCRSISKEEIKEKLDKKIPYVVRQKTPLEGVTTYIDAVFGEISIENKELQDQILLKTDGYPTYNFAHVVDDYLMGVTHVVRGSEYLTSTPKYALLYDAFGWDRPTYVHLPLLMGRNEDGSISKLSKRHGAVSFDNLLEEGYLPEAIINYIALLGWCPKDSNEEFFTVEDLKAVFSVEAISNSPSVFDYDKLLWFNGEYLKKLDFEVFWKMAQPYLEKAIPSCPKKEMAARILQTRVQRVSDIDELISFVEALPSYENDLFVNKKSKTTLELSKQILETMLPILEEVPNWTNDALYDALLLGVEKLGIKSKAVMWVVRIAVSGKSITPGGATELMELMGKQESLKRINLAFEKL